MCKQEDDMDSVKEKYRNKSKLGILLVLTHQMKKNNFIVIEVTIKKVGVEFLNNL